MRTEDQISQLLFSVAASKPTTILDLRNTVRFRRRTRSHPYDFSDFVEALSKSTTVRLVLCHAEFTLCLTDSEWVTLIKTFGQVKKLQEVRFVAPLSGTQMRCIPFHALAQFIRGASELRTLIFDRKTTFEGDAVSYQAFSNSLKFHPNLTRFSWKCDVFPPAPCGPIEGCFDPIATALATCPALVHAFLLFCTAEGVESFLSAEAVQTLTVASPNLKNLSLTTRHWQAIARGLEQKDCTLQRCSIGQSTATQADIEALSKALQVNNLTLRHLQLVSGTGFDDTMGITMAEALKNNKSLEMIEFHDSWWSGGGAYVRSFFREPTFMAFNESLSAKFDVNVILKVGIPKDDPQGARPGFLNFRISSILNRLGRGKLLTNTTTSNDSASDWIRVLAKLSDPDTYETPVESESLATSCIFSLLRSNPNMIRLGLGDNTLSNQRSTY